MTDHDAVRAADIDAIRARADARYAPDIFAAPGDVNALLDANDALAAEVERLKAVLKWDAERAAGVITNYVGEVHDLQRERDAARARVAALKGKLATARGTAGNDSSHVVTELMDPAYIPPVMTLNTPAPAAEQV